jgi:hypothetical protein
LAGLSGLKSTYRDLIRDQIVTKSSIWSRTWPSTLEAENPTLELGYRPLILGKAGAEERFEGVTFILLSRPFRNNIRIVLVGGAIGLRE